MDRKLDAGRASQCARVFRKLVVPGHLPESDYDNVAVDWLEKTSKIIDLVVKAGKDTTSDVMLDVINVLKVRPDSGAKRLRQIKNNDRERGPYCKPNCRGSDRVQAGLDCDHE